MKRLFSLLFILLSNVLGAESGQCPPELFAAIDHENVDSLRTFFETNPQDHALYSLEIKMSSAGVTPLMYAVGRGCPVSVDALVALGADVNAHDDFEELTVLMYACRCDTTKIVEALLNAKADVHRADIYNRTALTHAALFGAPNVVQTLIDHGADVDQQDVSGMTPLFYTIENNDLESAACLIKSGADLNKADATGFPPLFYAIFKQRHEHIKLLKAAGVSLHVKDGEGRTLEQFCEEFADEETFQLLGLEE